MHGFSSLLRLLALAVALSIAHPACATPIVIVGPALEEAFEGSDVVPGLKQLLGPEYTAFRRNFDESATPVPLKSGGLLLAGWRLGFPDSYGAVVVLHPDGSLDAAYYNAGQRAPRHFSNADQPHHLALRAWARQYVGCMAQTDGQLIDFSGGGTCGDGAGAPRPFFLGGLSPERDAGRFCFGTCRLLQRPRSGRRMRGSEGLQHRELGRMRLREVLRGGGVKLAFFVGPAKQVLPGMRAKPEFFRHQDLHR